MDLNNSHKVDKRETRARRTLLAWSVQAGRDLLAAPASRDQQGGAKGEGGGSAACTPLVATMPCAGDVSRAARKRAAQEMWLPAPMPRAMRCAARCHAAAGRRLGAARRAAPRHIASFVVGRSALDQSATHDRNNTHYDSFQLDLYLVRPLAPCGHSRQRRVFAANADHAEKTTTQSQESRMAPQGR